MKKDFKHAFENKEQATTATNLFVAQLYLLPIRQREDSLLGKMLQGNMPGNNFNFKKITYQTTDAEGKILRVTLWVSPDYVAIGNNADFIRMPLSPQAAELIADKFNCVLPTTKMVDEIYKAATHKLIPIPLTAARDSLSTFVYHNNLIQQQLKKVATKGIIAGIKKDVVQTRELLQNEKPNRVAIYGWHTTEGKPIQPLYSGHVDGYVDYSHGIRLVYEKMIINHKIYFVKEVLNNPLLAPSICKDAVCGAMSYTQKNAKIKMPTQLTAGELP